MISVFRRHVESVQIHLPKAALLPLSDLGGKHASRKKDLKSLDFSNWEAAIKRTRNWDHPPEKTLSVAEACEKFLVEAKARKLSEGSLLKHKQAIDLLKPLGKMAMRLKDLRDHDAEAP